MKSTKTEDQSEYDTQVSDLKKYYSKYKEHLADTKCISLNFGTLKKTYQRTYGYFCFSCLDKEICEECFFNCHKNCDPSLKLIARIKENLKGGFICPCNGDLFHTPRNRGIDSSEVKRELDTLGSLYSFLIKGDSNEKSHSEEDYNNLSEVVDVLRDKKNISLGLLSKYGRSQNIFQVFGKCFDCLKPINVNFYDYFFLFRAFQLLIQRNHFYEDFKGCKFLSFRDFKYSSYLDLLWYQKYLIMKINENEKTCSKYFEGQKKVESLKSNVIKDYLKKTLQFTDVLGTSLLENKEDLIFIAEIVCQNLIFLANHLLLDDEDVALVLKFAFNITKTLKIDMSSFKIKENPEKEINKENLFAFPYQLSQLIYMCSEIYNLKIFEDFINKGNSEKEFMFYNGNYKTECEDFKTKTIISFLKLINQKKNDIFTRNEEIKMLKEIFFSPSILPNEKIYSPLYFYFDTNSELLKNNTYKQVCDFNLNILNQTLKYLSNTEEEIKKLSKPEGDQTVKLCPFLQKDFEELKKLFEDFENFMNFDSIFTKKKKFLYKVKRNGSKLKTFYSKKDEPIYIDEFNENLNDVVFYLIAAGLDQSISFVLGKIFDAVLPLAPENEGHLSDVESLLRICLNILTLMSCTEIGLQALKIGETLDFFNDLILRKYDPEKINLLKKNEKYKNLFKKIYIFYISLPYDVKKIYNLTLNGEALWNDNLLEIIPIYNELFKYNEAANIKESVNLLDNYYNFMQLHKTEFDFVKIVKYIETNYTEENYKSIKLDDPEYKLSELYFQLLELVSNQHSFYTHYNFQPNKCLLHILSIEKCIALMNLPMLPLEKKSILLKSMLLIITSPYKSWKAVMATCLYVTLMKDDTDFIGGIYEKYVQLLNSEINKLNSSMIGKEDYRNYCIDLLDCIVYFSNFLYTQNVISSLHVRCYYMLYLDLKAADHLLQKIILNVDCKDFTVPKNFEDDDEFNILQKNSPNKVCFYYNSLYEKFYDLLKKYKDCLNSIISDNILSNYFSEKNKKLPFSDLKRYNVIFSYHLVKSTIPEDIKNNLKYKEIVENINKWKESIKEKSEDTANYTYEVLLHDKYKQFLNFKYGIRDNYPLLIFCLLSFNIDDATVMILRNSEKIIESLTLNDFKGIQNPNETYPLFLELLMKKLIYRLNFAVYSDLSIIKVYANTKIENEMSLTYLALMKLFQSLLANFNTTFAYFIFLKKYQSIMPYNNFDKTFDFGFTEKVYEKGHFDKVRKNVQTRINENLEENVKKNYSIIPYTLEDKYALMKYYGSVFSLGTIFSEDEMGSITIITYLLNFFEVCNDSISHRFSYMISKNTLAPDASLSILHNAVIDFYIQCFYNINLMIRKILVQTFLPYSLIYTRFTAGFLGQLGSSTEDLTNEYTDINLFIKMKKFDFANTVFSSCYFPFYKFYEISGVDSVKQQVDLSHLGEEYYDMILFYYQVINKRFQSHNEIGKKLNEMNKSKTPQEYCDKLMDLYLNYPEFTDNMEFPLIFRVFTFINILQYNYGYDFLCNHFKILDRIEIYDKEKLFSNSSLLSSGLYLFLKKICLVVKINFKVADEYKKKISKTQIFESEEDNKNRIEAFYQKYSKDLPLIENLDKKEEEKVCEKEEEKKEKKVTEREEESEESEESEEIDLDKYKLKFQKEVEQDEKRERLENIKKLIKKEHKKKHLFDTDDEYDRGQLDLVDWYPEIVKDWDIIANDAKILPAVTRDDINKTEKDNEEKLIFFTRKPSNFSIPTDTIMFANAFIDLIERGNKKNENSCDCLKDSAVPIEYFYFLCYLHDKNQEEFDTYEKCIWKLILKNDASWVPCFKTFK